MILFTCKLVYLFICLHVNKEGLGNKIFPVFLKHHVHGLGKQVLFFHVKFPGQDRELLLGFRLNPPGCNLALIPCPGNLLAGGLLGGWLSSLAFLLVFQVDQSAEIAGLSLGH